MDDLTAKKLASAARIIAEVQKEHPIGTIAVSTNNGNISIHIVGQESIDALPPGDIVYSPKGLTDFLPYKASVFREGAEFCLYLSEENCWPAYVNFNA